VDSNAWIAIGTFIGPIVAGALAALLAVWLGTKRLREEQEGRDVRTYLLDDGGVALKSAIDNWLELSRRNYVWAEHLLDAVARYPRSHALSPDPNEIPVFLPNVVPSFRFDAVIATSRLTGCLDLDEVMTKAMGALYNANLSWELMIRQPISRFYRGEGDWGTVAPDWHIQLGNFLRAEWAKVEQYAPLSLYLGDAVLRAQELRLSRMGEMPSVQGDPRMQGLARSISELKDIS
jgi:hypothetical protein